MIINRLPIRPIDPTKILSPLQKEEYEVSHSHLISSTYSPSSTHPAVPIDVSNLGQYVTNDTRDIKK